jgi:hypothetical protein
MPMPSLQAEGDFMKQFAAIVLISTVSLTGTACLKKQTTHVLYLRPAGAVTWVVRDADVHSDANDRSKAVEEESEFLNLVRGGLHPPLVALEALGGRAGATELIRSERPWEVRTSARFDRLDTLAEALLRELSITGAATMTSASDRTTLRVEWTDHPDVVVNDETDTPVLALVEELEDYRLVLIEGRFLAAEGFALSADGRAAVPVEQTAPANGRRHLSLTWTGR